MRTAIIRQIRRLSTTRPAILSSIQELFLLGFETGVQQVSRSTDAIIRRRRNILYGTMIQAGIDQLRLSGPSVELGLSSPLDKRITSIHMRDPDWFVCFSLVSQAFDEFIIDKDQSNKTRTSNFFLRSFLVDLLFALRQRRSLVTLSGIPNISHYQGKLPPELFVPIRNLFATFSPCAERLPGIRCDVSTKAVAQYEQILSSHLFDDYIKSSLELESAREPMDQAFADIRRATLHLATHNVALLTARNTCVTLLTITAKFVDTVLGGLPGKLASYAAELGAKALSKDHRLVVYDFNSNLDEAYITSRPSRRRQQNRTKAA